MNFDNCEFLLTGGCGSLAQTLVKLLLEEYKPKGIRLYNRDEGKVWLFKQKIEQWKKENPSLDTPVSFCLGDVRDKDRLQIACEGAHIVIHAAAMKQLPACEDNPFEAVYTNVIGTQNVIMAALESNSVKKVFNIGTDKNCLPIQLYGATKLVAEKLITSANNYSKGISRTPEFYSFRYGNIIGSKGSVVQLFREQSSIGKITITDEKMTRFWISLYRVAKFILFCIEETFTSGSIHGGEVFIPRMPSCSIMEIANIIAPGCKIDFTGIRDGEKLHEDLIHETESTRVTMQPLPERLRELGLRDYFIINPHAEVRKDKFSYNSLTNDWRLDKETMTRWINEKYAY